MRGMGKEGGCVPEGGREGVRAAGADVHPLGRRGRAGSGGGGGVFPYRNQVRWGHSDWSVHLGISFLATK